MKKQTKSNWRTIVFAAIAAIVFMFAASSPASAQTTYKVGDRIEVMMSGKWNEAKVLEVKGNGDYVIRYIYMDEKMEGWTNERYMRPKKAGAQTDKQNNADNQTQNQTDGNNRDNNQTPPQNSAPKTKTNRFEARDPRTCEDTKAPARGAITAALATKYLNCQMEFISMGDLYLVENLKVEVGGGVPYDPTLGAFEAINVRVPLYPIRGSLLRYQCQEVQKYASLSGENCASFNEPKAKGYCYKTTFGDWKCNMSDQAGVNKENARYKVAPPKP
jgi:hypothetical protein